MYLYTVRSTCSWSFPYTKARKMESAKQNKNSSCSHPIHRKYEHVLEELSRQRIPSALHDIVYLYEEGVYSIYTYVTECTIYPVFIYRANVGGGRVGDNFRCCCIPLIFRSLEAHARSRQPATDITIINKPDRHRPTQNDRLHQSASKNERMSKKPPKLPI